jgi:hypothetical protein
VYPEFHQVRSLWNITVDVSWDCVDEHHAYRLLTDPVRSFEAEDEAKQCGFELAKNGLICGGFFYTDAKTTTG